MFVVTQSITYMNALAAALLAALSARPAAGLLSTPTVHLCTNTPTITPFSAVGDFTEATFHGYAAAALPTLLGPINLLLDTIGIHGEVDFLATTGGTISDNVTGYYVTDGGGTTLYAAELFHNPIPFVKPGDALSLDVLLPFLESVQAQP